MVNLKLQLCMESNIKLTNSFCRKYDTFKINHQVGNCNRHVINMTDCDIRDLAIGKAMCFIG